MKTRSLLAAATMVFIVSGTLMVSSADSRLGLGVHYWRTVKSVPDGEISRDGMSWYVTYQRRFMPLLKWQADLEILPREFAGSDKEVFAPQLYAVVGGWIYGAIGAGILYSDGRFADSPFYNARAGLDLKLLPRTRFDLHVNYQFSEWSGINRADRDFDSDVIAVGLAVRMEI